MTEPVVVSTDGAPAPVGGAPYSQALVFGELVFCSGQTGLDPATGAMAPGGIEPETRQVIANLGAVLDAAGSGLDRVLKTTVFLTDIGDFAAMNAIYAELFGAPLPARSTVQVAKLPVGAIVEIECIARTG